MWESQKPVPKTKIALLVHKKGTRQFVLSNVSCALDISENVPRFALFSHPSLMHTSLAANPNSFDYKGFVTLTCQMCSSHERPTPSVKGEVATTIYQKLILPGSGEMPKVVTFFWRKEECYCINIAAPRTMGIDIQSHPKSYKMQTGTATRQIG